MPYGQAANHTSFLLDVNDDGCCGNNNVSSLEVFLSELAKVRGDDNVDYSELLEELASVEGDEGFASIGVHSTARQIVGFIELYVVPAVAMVGMLGNLLSFVVFVGTYLRTQSSSVYLAALSVADFGFLLTVFVSKLGMSGWDLYQHNGWCQFFSYITYVTSFLSMWYVVAFTVERYIATHFPFRRRTCTCKRATVVVIGLFLLAMVMYSFGMFTSGVTVVLDYPTCGPTPKYYKFVSIVYHIDTVMTLILPFVIILVLNLRIGCKVMQFYRQRSQHEMYEDISDDRACSTTRTRQLRISISANAQHGFSQRQWRVTRMLLAVSTTFLLLNLPRHTTRICTFIMSLSNKDFVPTGHFVLVQKIFQLLYYLHFSVNIFLYSGMEQTFRKAMCWLFGNVRSGVGEYCRKVCTCWGGRHRLVFESTVLGVSSRGSSRGLEVITPL